ncbi:hypothetical protein ZEAMMB73_Zm00001d023949 [Zea mays]|uniref:Uncharacterized protein n=1 Tax=Zea mays TaxID=4577 RepID=A0A1D6IWZ3_MAIZE|nr:hypothetical protein ZEAMMB73_Zm00001d023949 [Zea mays]
MKSIKRSKSLLKEQRKKSETIVPVVCSENYLCDANRSGELPNNLYLLVAQFFLVEVWALDTMVVNSLEKGVLFPFFFGRRSGFEPESP